MPKRNDAVFASKGVDPQSIKMKKALFFVSLVFFLPCQTADRKYRSRLNSQQRYRSFNLTFVASGTHIDSRTFRVISCSISSYQYC